MAHTVQVYSKSNCPYCVLAKNLLAGKGVDFQEINLDGREKELAELKERTGMRTVPQIFIDDQLIGGYQQLAELDVKGQLDQMLGE